MTSLRVSHQGPRRGSQRPQSGVWMTTLFGRSNETTFDFKLWMAKLHTLPESQRKDEYNHKTGKWCRQVFGMVLAAKE